LASQDGLYSKELSFRLYICTKGVRVEVCTAVHVIASALVYGSCHGGRRKKGDGAKHVEKVIKCCQRDMDYELRTK
jgi:hypothetical protein